MLTVAKVTGSHAAGYAEYLEGKTTATSAGDYYLKDGERVEAPGRWISGANAVGCDPAARLTGEQLRALMEVRRPDSGQPLRPAGSTGEAVAALDATFSAPKSVSAVWALADPALRARVEQAHEIAIDRALHYATRQVAMVRERVDRSTVIHTKPRELIATGWRHTTARAVDGLAPDPQLHTHVLLHAGVRRDGHVVAIDSRAWLTHRRELGAAYRTELARELHELGFEINRGTGRGSRYFEIDGVPQPLLDAWSSRHHQVQDAIQARLGHKRAELQAIIDADGPSADDARVRLRELEQTGLRAAEDRFLTHATRAAKTPSTRTGLDRQWRQTAAEHDLPAPALSQLRGTPGSPIAPDIDRLEARLTEHDASLTRSQARAIALESNAGLPIRDGLTQLAEMRDSDRLLTLTDGSLTTLTHRSREQATTALAGRLAAADVDPIPAPLVTQSTKRLDERLRDQGGSLSDEQRATLALSCGEGQLVVIEGQAGTGKSTVLSGIAHAHEAAGQQIIVTSTSALAAQRLADELTTSGTHPAAYSTVALTHAIQTGRLTPDPTTTIIHDEAALASTRELHDILDTAESTGARLILVGDPRQSPAVGAGGLWPHIETTAETHDARATLTRNLRANDPADARDQHHFRNGEIEIALTGYANRDRIHLHTHTRDAEDAALDAAFADRQAGRRTIVIAQTSNDHLDELNARAQAIRHQAGQLGDETLPLAGRPYDLHAGDQLQLRASIPHPEHGVLRNGTTATLTGIDPAAQTAHLRFDDGRDATLTADQLGHAQARLGYVQHPFPAQGTTTDSTHLIIAEHPTRQGTYVALTRARHDTHLYAATSPLKTDEPPLPQLAEHVGTLDPDLPSITHPIDHELDIKRQLHHANKIDDAPRPPRIDSHLGLSEQTHAADLPANQTRSPAPDHLAPSSPREPDQSWTGADVIVSYRQRYGIPEDDHRLLGPEPHADAFRQRLDRRSTARDAHHSLRDEDAAVLRAELNRGAQVAHEPGNTMPQRDP